VNHRVEVLRVAKGTENFTNSDQFRFRTSATVARGARGEPLASNEREE
jgi:hypothetical protein